MVETYSQKVARVFEVMGYVLLVPAGFGLIFGFLLVMIGLSALKIEIIVLGLIPFALAAVGITLLVGYHRRARNRLDEKYIYSLWIATIVYNFLLLLPWVYAVIAYFMASKAEESLGTLYFSTALIFGYAAIIYYSLKAYSFETFVKI